MSKLSDLIADFRREFIDEYADTGVAFEPPALKEIARILTAFQDDVAALERGLEQAWERAPLPPEIAESGGPSAASIAAFHELAESMAAKMRDLAAEEKRVVSFLDHPLRIKRGRLSGGQGTFVVDEATFHDEEAAHDPA